VEVRGGRFVNLVGAYNFRDLGGLPTADGRRTCDGVLFRSDALHHLTPEDVERIGALGIRTIVDLRSVTEVERTGRGLLAQEDIAWVHAPLTHADPGGHQVLPPALAAGDLGAHYVDSLGERTAMLASIIEQLSIAANLPVVFHCTAGKDRTGIVAALVLALVGVERGAIVEDYTLTDTRMSPIMDRLRSSGDLPETTNPVAAGIARAEAASMITFLEALQRGYGSAEGWAHRAGLSDATLASLRALLLAGDAS
jgi:protein-tyrosine phosphatase